MATLDANLIILGAKLDILGANLAILGANLAILGAHLAILGANLAILEANLAILGASCVFHGASLAILLVLFSCCSIMALLLKAGLFKLPTKALPLRISFRSTKASQGIHEGSASKVWPF